MAKNETPPQEPLETPPNQEKMPPFFKKKFMVIAMFILGIILLFPLAIFVISQLSDQGQISKTLKEVAKKTFAPTAPFVADQLIVKLKGSYTREELENLSKKLDELGLESQEKLFDSDDPLLKKYYILKFKPGTDIKKVGQELINLRELEEVEPNYIVVIQVIPQDPYYDQLWGLDRIQMPQTWDLVKGSNSIKIAVIDTGIDYNHQDFSGRAIVKGPDFAKCNEFGPTGECISPKLRDSDPIDDNGHGTHVAGTIGAVTNNNTGISGIDWDITLMAIKVMGRLGRGDIDDIVDGIKYAADNGAQVINISLGTPDPCISSYQSAINYALNKGAIVVAAAGNANVDARTFTPASCDGVITVGNSTRSDERDGNSNYGPRVDIAAPGAEIYSLVLGSSYGYKTGTSMASPHVAGVVGLLLTANPGLSQDQVKSCLINSADPITTDENIGPRLNAYKALTLCTNTVSIPMGTNVTPSPIASPTSEPFTPSSTAVKTYTCKEDSRGSTARPGSIKIGSLICEPN